MNLKDMADNGQGVSTIERDSFSLFLAVMQGDDDPAPFETVVFPKGELMFDQDLDLSTVPVEDVIPVHVVQYHTAEDASKGHHDILDAVNSGTLEYNGVPENF